MGGTRRRGSRSPRGSERGGPWLGMSRGRDPAPKKGGHPTEVPRTPQGESRARRYPAPLSMRSASQRNPLATGAAVAAICGLAACISAPRRPGIEFTEGRAQWVARQVSTLRGIAMPASAPVEQRSRRELAQEYDRLAREALDADATDRRIRADIALGFLPKDALGKTKMFTL